MKFDEFIKQAEALGDAMADEVIAAEQQFAYHNSSALPLRSYPNTAYWDKMGPIINSYRRQQREDVLGKLLDAEVNHITEKYQVLILALESQLTR